MAKCEQELQSITLSAAVDLLYRKTGDRVAIKSILKKKVKRSESLLREIEIM